MTTPVSVVLLAAGFGTRMYPLTEHTAKPLLEVGGVPVLTRLVQRIAQLEGLHSITVVSNDRFHQDMIGWSSVQNTPVPLLVVTSGATSAEDRRGAVADMALAMDSATQLGSRTGEVPDQRWLVMAGDNLLDHNLQPYLDAAGQSNAVLCRDLGGSVPPGMFGEITTDPQGRVIGFREKPMDPSSPLAATCTYVLTSEAPASIAAYLHSGGNPDAPGEFVGWLAQRQWVQAIPISGPYFDIGSLAALHDARRAFSSQGTSEARRQPNE